MKTLRVWIVTGIVLLTFLSSQSFASTGPRHHSGAEKIAEAEEARVILARIDEIHAMDKTGLTGSEKRELRNEVRASEMRMREMGGGVYVSVGALIIIVLLLIILL